MPMLNVRSMSASGTPPVCCSHWKIAGACHADRSIARVRARRQDARQVVGDAAAGDVRHPFDEACGRAAAGRPAGTSGAARAAPRRSARPSSGTTASHVEPGDVERNAPRQRVAVGVQSGRGQADRARRPARCVWPSIRRSRAHDADDEPGDVVLAVGVEAGHLGGLAAEQRAAVLAAAVGEPLDDLHGDVGVEPAGGQVVEEEQRLRALHEDVVDAVVDEVDADRVVHAGHERDAQLGADAVGARDQHRIVARRRRPSRNSPPNDPISDSTPGVNVPRASERIRRTTSLPASMSTPDCL